MGNFFSSMIITKKSTITRALPTKQIPFFRKDIKIIVTMNCYKRAMFVNICVKFHHNQIRKEVTRAMTFTWADLYVPSTTWSCEFRLIDWGLMLFSTNIQSNDGSQFTYSCVFWLSHQYSTQHYFQATGCFST